MNDVLILTCGGTGRELQEIAKETFNIIGFLDDNKVGPEICGTLADIPRLRGKAKFASGLGSFRSMNRRRAILEQIPLQDFVNVIAHDSRIYQNVEFGRGDIVFPFSVLSCGVRVGNHVLVYHNCVLAHDVTVGDYSIIANSATISGGVSIGSNCYIGAGATLLEGLTIGDNAIVAAGATVTRPVAGDTIYIAHDNQKANKYNQGEGRRGN